MSPGKFKPPLISVSRTLAGMAMTSLTAGVEAKPVSSRGAPLPCCSMFRITSQYSASRGRVVGWTSRGADRSRSRSDCWSVSAASNRQVRRHVIRVTGTRGDVRAVFAVGDPSRRFVSGLAGREVQHVHGVAGAGRPCRHRSRTQGCWAIPVVRECHRGNKSARQPVGRFDT